MFRPVKVTITSFLRAVVIFIEHLGINKVHSSLLRFMRKKKKYIPINKDCKLVSSIF